MAGKGKRVVFHGAYSRKLDAKLKEHAVKGFIRIVSIKGHKRYAVLTVKGVK